MIREKLAKLINLKSIITLFMTLVFCYLSITGVIAAELFLSIFTVVISFYFGVQMEKRNSNTLE